ncbi:hypothetical protein, partial [Bacillus anthracis]|uniref:hypothetical protein n=1 Tax=Bacillus anthracis TaxID=1392 RepID=UPI001E4E8095
REEARKVTKRGPNVADKTQKGILKQAVQFAPPGLLQDSNIFPLSQEVIQAFLQLTERSRPTVISSGLFDVVVDDQYQYSLIDTRDGTVLFSADVAAAFEYIKKFVPQALFNFARVAREFGVGDPETGQVYEVLLKHRKQRSASKGLDTLSKIDELAAIDQDHVVFKFPVEHFKICDKVLHIGAGTNVGGSQFVLWDNYDRVKCIDPRLTPDRHNESALFDARKVEPGWDIVSDVANGDEYGLTLFHQNKLLDELWDLRHGRMIMVKLGVSEDVRKDIRGIFARKPRPHNLEGIGVLA